MSVEADCHTCRSSSTAARATRERNIKTGAPKRFFAEHCPSNAAVTSSLPTTEVRDLSHALVASRVILYAVRMNSGVVRSIFHNRKRRAQSGMLLIRRDRLTDPPVLSSDEESRPAPEAQRRACSEADHGAKQRARRCQTAAPARGEDGLDGFARPRACSKLPCSRRGRDS